jgi:hypothetical protein
MLPYILNGRRKLPAGFFHLKYTTGGGQKQIKKPRRLKKVKSAAGIPLMSGANSELFQDSELAY